MFSYPHHEEIYFVFFNVYTYLCEGLPLSLHNRILFRNNSASTSGNSIYGGHLAQCEIRECHSEDLTGFSLFQQLFDIPWGDSLTEVTSDIEQICFCVNGIPDCSLMTWPVSTYPGGRVQVPIVAVGQLNGTNPGIVLSDTTKEARIAKVK